MPGKKILVVDDSRDVRETIARLILRPAGYETLTADDGLTGLQAAREQHPDLIIADLQMPGLSGIQLKRTLTLESILTPLILMTGEGSESIASEATLAGVSAYFPKPVDPDVLLIAVEQALKYERLRQERATALHSLEKRVHQLETLQAVGRILPQSN